MIIKIVDLSDEMLINRIMKFVNSHDNIDVKQTIEWGILRNEEKILLYAEDEQKNICMYLNGFIVYDKEVKQRVIYVPRGPVYDGKTYSLEQCLNVICDYAYQRGFKYIRTNPKEKNLNITNLIHKSVLFIQKNDYLKLRESPREAILELKRKSEQLLLEAYHYKTRYNIRKSMRYGVKTLIQYNINLDEFYRLYLITSVRHGFTPHSKQYFEKLLNIFKDRIVFGITEYNNQTLAMSINIKQANTLFYLYGVSSDEHRNKFACYNLHNTMIEFALNNGFEYYHFGGVFSDDEDKENKDYGLLVFKSRFCTSGFTEYNPDMLINLEG